MADKFKVYVGKQVVFSSEDSDLCAAVAQERRLEAIRRGNALSSDEHRVHVAESEE